MGPVICMITAPMQPGDAAQPLVDRIGAAAKAGVHLIQVRQPNLEGRALHAIVERARVAAEGTRARILVNDRVDVAVDARAHGVHLRGDSMPASRVRAVARGPLTIGRSVHTPDEGVQVSRDGAIDYLIFGSVFAPHSKSASGVAGIEALAATCRGVALPVLAVGGMSIDRLLAVAHAGASGFAAIGLFADAPIDALGALVAEAARAFDTPGALP